MSIGALFVYSTISRKDFLKFFYKKYLRRLAQVFYTFLRISGETTRPMESHSIFLFTFATRQRMDAILNRFNYVALERSKHIRFPSYYACVFEKFTQCCEILIHFQLGCIRSKTYGTTKTNTGFHLIFIFFMIQYPVPIIFSVLPNLFVYFVISHDS